MGALRNAVAVGAALLAGAAPALAHELDEYVQAAIIAVDRGRVRVELRLTPGAHVFRHVRSAIDSDRDGAFSEAERRAYAERVLRDLSLSVDGAPQPLRLVFVAFASIEDLREGTGVIEIVLEAPVPPGGPERRLAFENRHMRRVSAYLVNGLVPRDPRITLGTQRRDSMQSQYELRYVEASAGPAPAPAARVAAAPPPPTRWSAARPWMGAAALPLLAWLRLLGRRRNGVADS